MRKRGLVLYFDISLDIKIHDPTPDYNTAEISAV